MKALLVIDVQNDFLPGGALAVTDGDKIIPFINEIAGNYDQIVATQDLHPANHGSFAVNHNKEIGTVIDFNGLPQLLWPVHCVNETKGAEFNEKLTVEFDTVVVKGTDETVDSYSGFFDNGKRNQTELHTYLQTKGITELDVVGLATDYCVKFTVIDALELGYKVNVLLNGCRGVNIQEHDVQKAVQEMENAGAVIVKPNTHK